MNTKKPEVSIASPSPAGNIEYKQILQPSELPEKAKMPQASPLIQNRHLNIRCLKTSGEARGQISNMENRNDMKGTYFEKIIMSPKLKFRSLRHLQSQQKTKPPATRTRHKNYERGETEKNLLSLNNAIQKVQIKSEIYPQKVRQQSFSVKNGSEQITQNQLINKAVSYARSVASDSSIDRIMKHDVSSLFQGTAHCRNQTMSDNAENGADLGQSSIYGNQMLTLSEQNQDTTELSNLAESACKASKQTSESIEGIVQRIELNKSLDKQLAEKGVRGKQGMVRQCLLREALKLENSFSGKDTKSISTVDSKYQSSEPAINCVHRLNNHQKANSAHLAHLDARRRSVTSELGLRRNKTFSGLSAFPGNEKAHDSLSVVNEVNSPTNSPSTKSPYASTTKSPHSQSPRPTSEGKSSCRKVQPQNEVSKFKLKLQIALIDSNQSLPLDQQQKNPGNDSILNQTLRHDDFANDHQMRTKTTAKTDDNTKAEEESSGKLSHFRRITQDVNSSHGRPHSIQNYSIDSMRTVKQTEKMKKPKRKDRYKELLEFVENSTRRDSRSKLNESR